MHTGPELYKYLRACRIRLYESSSCCKVLFSAVVPSIRNKLGSGYGYGTVPGGRWTIDTEVLINLLSLKYLDRLRAGFNPL